MTDTTREAAQAPALTADDVAEAMRKQFVKLPRFSFLLDGAGNVRRVADRCGHWVDFEAAHTLFDPVCVDAALTAAPQAPTAPEGWRLAPVEATPEMTRAAVVFANGNAVYKNVAAAALQIEESIYAEVWEAMLAAAPQAVPPAALTDDTPQAIDAAIDAAITKEQQP